VRKAGEDVQAPWLLGDHRRSKVVLEQLVAIDIGGRDGSRVDGDSGVGIRIVCMYAIAASGRTQCDESKRKTGSLR
jgi:hypothetical protein